MHAGLASRGTIVRDVSPSIEEHRVQEVHPGDPVGHCVVDARRDRLAPVGQRADHVEGPQRLAAIEMLRHQPADDPPQVGLGDALRVGAAPDVLADVERLRRNPARFRARGVHPAGRPRLGVEPLGHGGAQ